MFNSYIILNFALMITVTDITNNIKQAIKDRELTLEKVAERMNVSSSALSHLLKEGANPSLGKIIEIAEILNVPLADFCKLNGNGTRHPSNAGGADSASSPAVSVSPADASDINSLLKSAIHAKGMSIGSVAAKMRNERGGYTGVSQQSLSTMLRGRIAFDRVEEICGILGISLIELLSGAGAPNGTPGKNTHSVDMACPHCGEPFRVECETTLKVMQ